jgi:YD repeat-containing protein
MLGRLTSETNPETANLAYTYIYDTDSTCASPSSGDLIKRTDAKGNVTCYAYDALHRVTSVTYPSGPNSSGTAKKYFVYDAATVNNVAMVNAKGRLAEAYTCTSCPGTKITDLGYSYSAGGEVIDAYQWTTHSGAYYHITASFFAYGALNALSGIPTLPTCVPAIVSATSMRIQADKIVASIATISDCGSYSSSRDSKAAVLDTPMLKSRGVVRWRFAVSATSKYGYTEIDFQYSSSSTTQASNFRL